MIFIYILEITITLLLALTFFLPVLQAKKSNIITEGTIVRVRCEKLKGNILYYITFKFCMDGKEYIKESLSAVSENIYKEGQQIKVAYYKENPMDAIMLSDKKAMIVMGIGRTIFAVLAGFSVILAPLGGDILSRKLPPSYILLVVGFIILIICYYISKKQKE